MPSTTRYVALLRGINVGGQNVIGKEDLRCCFESLGMQSVRTYIQSGNILFRSTLRSGHRLTDLIERGLSRTFSYDARAVVLSQRQYNAVMSLVPEQWGIEPSQRHNLLFTLRQTTPQKIIAALPEVNTAFESVVPARHAIFWSVAKDRISRSCFRKLPQRPEYQQVTIRNHNTAWKLQSLLDEI